MVLFVALNKNLTLRVVMFSALDGKTTLPFLVTLQLPEVEAAEEKEVEFHPVPPSMLY